MLIRFIGVMNPLKYASMFPTQRARLVIIIPWMAGFLLLTSRPFFHTFVEFFSFIALGIELSVLGFIITTFALMALRIKKHKQSFSRSCIQSKISAISGTIIMTFIFLVLIPDVISLTMLVDESSSLAQQLLTTLATYTSLHMLITSLIQSFIYMVIVLKETKLDGKYFIGPCRRLE